MSEFESRDMFLKLEALPSQGSTSHISLSQHQTSPLLTLTHILACYRSADLLRYLLV